MYYEVKAANLIEQIEAWMDKRQEAQDAFLRLSRRVGASRNRYASGESFGSRSFAFIFNREPDRKHWKQNRHGYWLPKLSSKSGKKINEEVRVIQRDDGHHTDLSKIFGVDDFLKNVGIQLVSKRWIVTFGEDWKFSTRGLKRISDVTLEKLEKQS